MYEDIFIFFDILNRQQHIHNVITKPDPGPNHLLLFPVLNVICMEHLSFEPNEPLAPHIITAALSLWAVRLY